MKAYRPVCLFIPLLLVSCSNPKVLTGQESGSNSIAVGDPGFRDTIANVLLNPNEKGFNQKYYAAWHGDPVAMSMFFADAQKQCQSSEIDAEENMAMTYMLQSLLSRIGDVGFESQLVLENEATRSAVKYFLGDVSQYSRVQRLFDKTPAYDFPLLRANRLN